MNDELKFLPFQMETNMDYRAGRHDVCTKISSQTRCNNVQTVLISPS
jgi:hypothetical protein